MTTYEALVRLFALAEPIGEATISFAEFREAFKHDLTLIEVTETSVRTRNPVPGISAAIIDRSIEPKLIVTHASTFKDWVRERGFGQELDACLAASAMAPLGTWWGPREQ